MGMLNVYCRKCGAENLRGFKCAHCGASLSDATTAPNEVTPKARPRFGGRNQNTGMVIWLLASLGLALVGALSLSEATLGVGVLILSVICAIFARIAQAGALHDRAEKHLEFLSRQPPQS